MVYYTCQGEIPRQNNPAGSRKRERNMKKVYYETGEILEGPQNKVKKAVRWRSSWLRSLGLPVDKYYFTEKRYYEKCFNRV